MEVAAPEFEPTFKLLITIVHSAAAAAKSL